MKAHYATISQTELDRKVHELAMQKLEEYKDELYDKVKMDVFDQALAVCFTALELMGWRKKRLTDFLHQIDDVTHLMYTGALGKETTTRDAQKHLKDAYGIDFSESRYDYGEENHDDDDKL